MMKVTFKFDIGSAVLILSYLRENDGNSLSGVVSGNYVAAAGQKWAVVDYLDTNGVMHSDYFQENYLMKAPNG